MKKLLERTSWRVRFPSALANSGLPCKKGQDINYFDFGFPRIFLSFMVRSLKVKILPETVCTFYICSIAFLNRIVSHQHDSAGIVATINVSLFPKADSGGSQV